MDQELQRLIARDQNTGLNRLEADIWQREQAHQAARVTTRRLVSFQGLVLATAVLGAAALGVTTARAVAAPKANWLGGSARLAPTVLLFGSKP